MYISRIYLKNFRNYGEETIDLDENVNIVYGKNAQGKTNLLESVFLCSTGRSHRTARDNDLVKNGTNAFTVRITGYKKDNKK